MVPLHSEIGVVTDTTADEEAATDRANGPDASSTNRWQEPIAIIGLALDFPGASSPSTFWDLLMTGSSARIRVPEDRFNIDAFYFDSEDNKTGKGSQHIKLLTEHSLTVLDQQQAWSFSST